MRDGVEKRLFVAATNQNDGKTTSSLGFVKGFSQIAGSVGFIKPVGQRFVSVDSQKIDEDSLLVQQAFGLRCPLKDMNPIAISPTFTRDFLENPDGRYPQLEAAIMQSFQVAAEGNDLVVIEGTGHAGVGSIFGMSNARVAKILNAKVVIVTLGGIGRPVDEVAVNRSLFEKEGVPVIGVVVNKVTPDKLDQTRYYLSKAFETVGLPLLGVIPFAPRLTWPTVQQVAEAMGAEVLNGCDRLANPIADVIIGAMTPNHCLTYLWDNTLLIVPGDRDDVVLAAVTMVLLRKDIRLSGIVFTSGLQPQPETMDLVCRTDIPVLRVDAGTYDAAARTHDVLVKIRVADEAKINLATSLVRENVDLDKLWTLLS
ncbi:MAG: phosphotransacetylase family protein [Armatimonadota bacterium]